MSSEPGRLIFLMLIRTLFAMTQQTASITREQFFDFVRKKGDTSEETSAATKYYLAYIDKYQETGKKISWNWAAFFFTFQWMLYRKMYLTGLLSLAIFISSVLCALIMLPLKTGASLWVVGSLTSLFYLSFGNYIYYKNLAKRIRNNAGYGIGKNVDLLTFFASFFSIPFCVMRGICTSITDRIEEKIKRRVAKFFIVTVFLLTFWTCFVAVIFDDGPVFQSLIQYGKSHTRKSLRAIGVSARIAQDAVDVANTASLANLAKGVLLPS